MTFAAAFFYNPAPMNTVSRRFPRTSIVACALFLAACGSPSAPTAAPTPAPTPAPVPSATPRAFSCPLPALSDDHRPCSRPAPQLQAYVDAAVDNVLTQQPQLFNFNDVKGGSVKVLDRQKYQTAVVAAVNALGGVCAKDDNEEIALKVSNDFNEQYNIWTSSGYTRRSHITTCFPARF